jgi:ribosomal protein L22
MPTNDEQEDQIISAIVALDWTRYEDQEAYDVIVTINGCSYDEAKAILADLVQRRRIECRTIPASQEGSVWNRHSMRKWHRC